MFSKMKILGLVSLITLLTACGGGGGGNNQDQTNDDLGNGLPADVAADFALTCEGDGTGLVGCWKEPCHQIWDDSDPAQDTYGYIVYSFMQDGSYGSQIFFFQGSEGSTCENGYVTSSLPINPELEGSEYTLTGNTVMTDQSTTALEINKDYYGLTYYSIVDISTGFLCYADNEHFMIAGGMVGWYPSALDAGDRPTSVANVLTPDTKCMGRLQ